MRSPNAPPGGGNCTRHTADIREHAHDTICCTRHVFTPPYSRIHTTIFRTRPFRTRATTRGTETRARRPLRPRYSQRPPPGRARPAGRRPGAPRGFSHHRTHLGRTGPPGDPYGRARERASRPRAAAPPAAGSASSSPSTPPTLTRPAPPSAAAAVAVPAAQSRCTCFSEAFTAGHG